MTATPTALEDLQQAEASLKAAGKVVSERMSTLWDQDNRTWLDPEQGDFLHDLLNAQVKVMNSLRFARRALEREGRE